jgi:hypothetical protein
LPLLKVLSSATLPKSFLLLYTLVLLL